MQMWILKAALPKIYIRKILCLKVGKNTFICHYIGDFETNATYF